LIAAVLGAGYAYLVLFGVALMTETPFIVALLFALDLAHELVEKPTLGKWIGLGVALAFTILLRMAILPFVVVLLGWVCWRSQVRPRMVHLGIPLVIIGLALLPWTIRNYRLYGRFMLLESQFGHIFWNANHLSHGSRFSDADWVAPLPDDIRDLNEADKTYTLLQRGIQNVRADPVRYIRLCISRIPVFFTFWPTAESSTLSNVARVLSFGILLPFMVCGLILSVRQWRRYSLIYFFAIFHSGIHLASWAMIRYRLPIDAVLLPFAAAAIAQIWDFFVQQYRSNLRVPPAGPDRKSHQVEQPLP
jgi:hypothetical protein